MRSELNIDGLVDVRELSGPTLTGRLVGKSPLLAAPYGFDDGLSAAQRERLEMLAEEAGEIVQAAMKILRHGYESHHPGRHVSSRNNRTDLQHELGDLIGVMGAMIRAGDIDQGHIDLSASTKWDRARPYTHHQPENLW